MATIVDKRFTVKDGAVTNRQKFIKRYKKAIKTAVRGILDKESIKDFTFKGKKIKIKSGDDEALDLPYVHHDSQTGQSDSVHVGNKKYRKGDKIDKPNGGGQGNKGGKGGGGEDEFEFSLTKDEFASLFFEDLALPDMIKRNFVGDAYETQHMGYSSTGGPSSLNIKQTILRAFVRRKALQSKQDEKDKLGIVPTTKRKIQFIEERDMRYNYRDKVEVPSTRAVMFCLMDVSGSMGEKEKDIAKRFFLLLSLFLEHNYDIVDIVFVRHAEWADECDEETFFHGRESGGTIVSAGLEKVKDIIVQRYNPDIWNIYVAQATDGDNYSDDNEIVESLLSKSLLPVVQYYAYVEISNDWRGGDEQESEMFDLMAQIGDSFKNLEARYISDYDQIYEVFRSLFTRGDKK